MTERLGTVLYAGGYDPKTQAPPELTGFYQNFSVKTPDIETGLAVLSVVHLELVGVSSYFQLVIMCRQLTVTSFSL